MQECNTKARNEFAIKLQEEKTNLFLSWRLPAAVDFYISIVLGQAGDAGIRYKIKSKVFFSIKIQ